MPIKSNHISKPRDRTTGIVTQVYTYPEQVFLSKKANLLGSKVALLPSSSIWARKGSIQGTVTALSGDLLKVLWEDGSGSDLVNIKDVTTNDKKKFKWPKYVFHQRAGLCEKLPDELCEEKRGRKPKETELFLKILKPESKTKELKRKDGYYLGAVQLCTCVGNAIPPTVQPAQIWTNISSKASTRGKPVVINRVPHDEHVRATLVGSNEGVRIAKYKFSNGTMRFLGKNLEDARIKTIEMYEEICALCGLVKTSWDEGGKLISVGHICMDEWGDPVRL